MARLLALMSLILLMACGGRTYQPDAPAAAGARILVMGDSLMAWNRLQGASVGRALSRQLNLPVTDNSGVGATFGTRGSSAGGIQGQFRDGPWDWVVMNGGGNNLLFACGCAPCDRELDLLISEDGTRGAIPQTVARARAEGARVIFTGYLRSPGFASPVEGCGPTGDRMDQRLARMAARDPGVTFLPLSDLVQTPGDTSYHAADAVHPSAKGSAAIAARLAAIIRG